MIKFEHTDVYGFQHAIRGMRQPFKVTDKSDSGWVDGHFFIGPKDRDLCQRLNKGGSPHNKFLRQIECWVDITAPRHWWMEMATYRFGVEVNSESTMHTILKNPFTTQDFSFERMPGYKNEVKQFKPDIDESCEEWKEWKGYKVSSEGRIIGKHGKPLSGSLHDDGYLFAYVNGKQVPYHRIIAECFCDGYSPELTVNHKDGNKQNNKASNLEWVTLSENHQHAIQTGLQPKTVKTYKGKFTPEQRQEIKRLWDETGMSRREIAKVYGVSHTGINAIINDKYKYADKVDLFNEYAKPLVDYLNELRDSYFLCEDEVSKAVIWRTIIDNLPQSYLQRRSCMMSYQAIRSICQQRAGHKLGEWHEFIKWAHELPESWLLFDEEGKAAS